MKDTSKTDMDILKESTDTIMDEIKKRTHIIIVNGLGGCGKSTFIQDFCQISTKDSCDAKEFSTVDFVKEVALYCGWRGEKETKDRIFLHELKEALTKWGNIPNKKTLEEIDKQCGINHFLLEYDTSGTDCPYHIFSLVNIRESEYIKDFINLCKENGYTNVRTLLVTNANKQSNEVPELVDDILYGIEYDDIIQNDGTLDDLYNKAQDYYEFLISGRKSYYD